MTNDAGIKNTVNRAKGVTCDIKYSTVCCKIWGKYLKILDDMIFILEKKSYIL